MLTVSAIGPSALGSASMPKIPTQQPAEKQGAASFSSALMNAAQQVNSLQSASAEQARAFVLGQTTDIHSVMIASQKASVALEVTTQVRNKVLEAYQEVMRMTM